MKNQKNASNLHQFVLPGQQCTRAVTVEKSILPLQCQKNWFLLISKPLENKVKDMGKWAAMENTDAGGLVVFTWSGEKGIGKKFLLTNLLEKKPGKQPSNHPPGWDAYKLMFDNCDKVNRKL